MSQLDSILAQFGNGASIAQLAERFGVDAKLAETAVAALGKAHAEPGDTVSGAAAASGLDAGTLGQILAQLGGDGALDQISGMLKEGGTLSGVLGMLDRDGDGNPLNDIAGFAKGLLR